MVRIQRLKYEETKQMWYNEWVGFINVCSVCIKTTCKVFKRTKKVLFWCNLINIIGINIIQGVWG